MSSSPTVITFDYALFQLQIPSYANSILYPEALVENFWNIAINYVNDTGNYGCMQGPSRAYAINLMTAHLIYLQGLIAAGQVPGLVQDSQVDKIQVSLTPPPVKNQFDWWLSLTPYGQSLLALLQVSSVGGFYIGGSPVLSSLGYRNGFYPYVC